MRFSHCFSFFVLFSLLVALCSLSPATCQYSSHPLDYSFQVSSYDPLQDYGYLDGSIHHYDTDYYTSGAEESSGLESFAAAGSKKLPLQAVRMPLLTVKAPEETRPVIELSPIQSTQIIRQPIKMPRLQIQPIIQQRLVEQPILRTHLVHQPLHRYLITQPVIQPELIQTTQVKRHYQEQPIVVPKLSEQSIVQEELQEEPQTAKTQIRRAIRQVQQPVLTKEHLQARAPIQANPGLMQRLGLQPVENVLAAQPIQMEEGNSNVQPETQANQAETTN
jgi:hypothetical protein